ncbi:hypothetical protein [Streptomyces sp. IBSBF 2435]|uniref:hypothetical protein n=1 Tax=Streptomyces sp. IBSBF 2435 TaxID=2903531 RepID=UPI002FDC0E31
MRLRSARTLATAAASAALAVGGIAAATTPAAAATGPLHCANDNSGSYAHTITGCDSYADTGGPYVFHVDTYYIFYFAPGMWFGIPVLYYTDATVTCQSLVSLDPGNAWYPTNCTATGTPAS